MEIELDSYSMPLHRLLTALEKKQWGEKERVSMLIREAYMYTCWFQSITSFHEYFILSTQPTNKKRKTKSSTRREINFVAKQGYDQLSSQLQIISIYLYKGLINFPLHFRCFFKNLIYLRLMTVIWKQQKTTCVFSCFHDRRIYKQSKNRPTFIYRKTSFLETSHIFPTSYTRTTRPNKKSSESSLIKPIPSIGAIKPVRVRVYMCSGHTQPRIYGRASATAIVPCLAVKAKRSTVCIFICTWVCVSPLIISTLNVDWGEKQRRWN